VAYFTDGRPLPGRADFEYRRRARSGVSANDDNRAFFVAYPDIYGPQFGGYDPVDVAAASPSRGSRRSG